MITDERRHDTAKPEPTREHVPQHITDLLPILTGSCPILTLWLIIPESDI